MYLIDASYFTRELSIPNATESNTGAAEELNYFIDDKVRLFLQKVLGFALFTELDSQITDGELDDDADDKWDKLVNGTTYTKDGIDYRWNGLLYTNGNFKVSLLANMTFHEWLSFQFSQMSGVGEVSLQAKNAIGVNNTQRLVTVWNDFVEMYQGCSTTYRNFTEVYGVPFYDYYTNKSDGYVSLVQFLKDNDADYPDAPVPYLNVKNQLGL